MSTRATIAHGKNFHLFQDLGDHQHIYLELDTTNFEAGYGQVTVPIPVHVWEAIREFPGVRLDLAGLSDAQLRQRVEQGVDERIRAWRAAKGERSKNMLSFCGSMAYGPASDTRTKQLRHGLAYYRRERKWQREVKAAIKKLRWENSPEGRKKRAEEHNRRAARYRAKLKKR